MNLDGHLGKLYHDRVIRGRDTGAKAEFMKALNEDSDLMQSARVEMNRLDTFNAHCNGQLDQRDFIGAQHLKYLKECLDNG